MIMTHVDYEIGKFYDFTTLQHLMYGEWGQLYFFFVVL